MKIVDELKRVFPYAKATWKWLRRAFKSILRFFNLLEPDVPYMVLSLSKMSVWLTLGLTVFVVSTGQGMAEMGAALLSNVGAIGNYAYRRRMQVHTRTGGYGYNGGGYQEDDMGGTPDPFGPATMPTADIPFEEEPQP